MIHNTFLHNKFDAIAHNLNALLADWDKPGKPGCAVGVIQNGEIVYRREVGTAVLEHDISITAQTLFDIASTSKQFTAFCVQMLAHEGRLSLDDDIRLYISEMPDYGHLITIRHLIHHTSGLRDYCDLMEQIMGLSMINDYAEADILALLARQNGLNFAPGEQWMYCNSGYFLLGEIVARVSGQTLGDFARERIFAPLGMDDTRFYDDHTAVILHRSAGYAYDENGRYRNISSKLDIVGDGGVFTNVSDLAKWDANFYDNQLGGGQAFIAQMLSPGTLNDGTRLDYASGLFVSTYRGLPLVEHGGSWLGYRSEFFRFPQQQTSLICLSNLNGAPLDQLIRQMADIVLADRFTEPATAQEEEEPAPSVAAPITAVLSDYPGHYHSNELETTFKVVVLDGRLACYRGYEKQPVWLTAVAADRFTNEDIDVTLHFTRDANGDINGVQSATENVAGIPFQKEPTAIVNEQHSAQHHE